jgi:hypothetical protein
VLSMGMAILFYLCGNIELCTLLLHEFLCSYLLFSIAFLVMC